MSEPEETPITTEKKEEEPAPLVEEAKLEEIIQPETEEIDPDAEVSIHATMEKAIDNGWNICIWPESMKQKDLNDMILSGIQEMKLIEIININTYNGLFAKTKLASWRKK